MLKPSIDFNEKEIVEIEKILIEKFSKQQVDDFSEWYNDRYFETPKDSSNYVLSPKYFLPSIIRFIIYKSEENNIFLLITCSSSNTGERKDETFFLKFELDSTISVLRYPDNENDSKQIREEKRNRINNILENATLLLNLKD